MFLNSVYSRAVTALRVLNCLIGLLCLVTLYKAWGFIRSRYYWKEAGQTAVNVVIFMLLYAISYLLLAITVDEAKTFDRLGCVFFISFEIYQLSTLTTWFFFHVVILNDQLRMYHWPSLSHLQGCLIAYITPGVTTTILSAILWSVDEFIGCGASENSTALQWTIDTCDVCRVSGAQGAFASFVVLPMVFVTLGLAVQSVRCLLVANAAWNMQNFSFRRKLNALSKRSGLIRNFMKAVTLALIATVTMTLLFSPIAHASNLRIIYSSFMTSVVLVVFIDKCLLSHKESNPFVMLRNWQQAKVAKKEQRKRDFIELKIQEKKVESRQKETVEERDDEMQPTGQRIQEKQTKCNQEPE